MMQSIADITGGKYWNGADNATFDAIFREIQSLTRRPIVTERIVHHQSLDAFFYPILFVLVLGIPIFEYWIIRKYRVPIV